MAGVAMRDGGRSVHLNVCSVSGGVPQAKVAANQSMQKSLPVLSSVTLVLLPEGKRQLKHLRAL